ncbi:CheR family methyltransferase [Methylobacterium gnaphalii]|uniref:Chemotaxis protein methyltransferase n=1 Tax=Methylobacterium gnaphalii TaxID=1010610 RepID=A0A512JQG4_9HYPH|nr:protein-glutamate O-methyltransferase CheR [Methylobacterium gnaphalii]GEP12205.1 chemotaxis protein methyltransferase 2 [Methylobacterium gnaphalii]GJD67457.1 Chemotaxis protein methyltransferase 1 [Methylobacterium gnaphalii]GLS51327.1 chemotaxis protein methyltransferase 2 [Methylobacterium gnaphalii]
MTDADFARFCEFLYRRTGMLFTPAKRYFVDRRLAERMKATLSRSFGVYLALLRSDADGEVEKLINAFTINETYFYREDHQLRCLTSSLLPELVGRKPPGSTVRIWSMPCSTGEEPYSVAIWLLETWPEVDRYDVEIVGSDIDTRALAAAEEGHYGERALMRLSPELVARYFVREETRLGPSWRILAELRDSVRFTPCNLTDTAEMAVHGLFDVVFCRNVLIYFDDASRRLAADNIYDVLVPGGFVCLGHTESMSRISPLFRVCRYDDAIVYRRPREGEHV